MIERNNYIPPILKGAQDYFITEERQSGRLLGKVWEILDNLCSSDSSSKISLEVPSQTLVNLGLVSEIAEGEIVGRINRKKQRNQPDEPNNKISFKRISPAEFIIRKTYVSEEKTEFSFYEEKFEAPFRIDQVMTEQTILLKEGEGYRVDMKVKADDSHLHAKGQRWIPAISGKENQWLEVNPGVRDLNRTLALILEGLVPGCLGNQKLF